MEEMTKETSDLGERMDPPPEKMISDEDSTDQSKEPLAGNKATQEQSNVIRIVNLGDRFTEATLRDFLQEKVQPNGKVQQLYIRKNDLYKIFYAYVIFELGCDAVKATEILNGHIFNTSKFDVALIGPDLPMKNYTTMLYEMRMPQLREESLKMKEEALRRRREATRIRMAELRTRQITHLPLGLRLLRPRTTGTTSKTLNTEVQNESAKADYI